MLWIEQNSKNIQNTFIFFIQIIIYASRAGKQKINQFKLN